MSTLQAEALSTDILFGVGAAAVVVGVVAWALGGRNERTRAWHLSPAGSFSVTF